jgi:hypothetical protein
MGGNIKMVHNEIGSEGVEWIYMDQCMRRWCVFVNTVMNLRVPQNVGNFLTKLLKNACLSSMTLVMCTGSYLQSFRLINVLIGGLLVIICSYWGSPCYLFFLGVSLLSVLFGGLLVIICSYWGSPRHYLFLLGVSLLSSTCVTPPCPFCSWQFTECWCHVTMSALSVLPAGVRSAHLIPIALIIKVSDEDVSLTLAY